MIECNTDVEELNFIRKKSYEIMLRKKSISGPVSNDVQKQIVEIPVCLQVLSQDCHPAQTNQKIQQG